MGRVDIVIVSYKCARLTIDCLRSVDDERRRVRGLILRAIVVDNASGDLSEIRQFVEQNGWSSWIALIESPRNGGFAFGNNLGIEYAFSVEPPSYVYLLNPDTQIRVGAVSALVQFLDANPGVGIAGGSFENADGSDWPIAFRFPTLLSELIGGMEIGPLTRVLKRWEVARRMTSVPQPTDWICGASMLIRPAVFTSIGGMDENYFLYFEETDFCFRAMLAGFSTWYVPESRVMHIMGQSTAVTDISGGMKRLPAYWFESRRRYFVMTFGVSHAIAIDIVALIAHSIGTIKRLLLLRHGRGVPFFLRDLMRHSVIRVRNRACQSIRCFKPRQENL